ncbi:hypothetical protein DFJ63DRAFT_254682 [Scheffersomyces coipomensis]|uniref:uncharacterized protein n=1 Tax=Scheffersomyces coipomensis TaxID=1788519 RepID=UPI00315D2F0D
MSLEVRGMFDDSLKYFANVISNNLRNEVQLIEVEEESTQIIARNYVCKYELEPEQKISSIEWIQRVSSSNNRKGRGKKRSAHPEDVNHNGLSLPVLAVLLNSTEVWLFTPGISQPTGKISTDFPISCISKSYNTENSLLVFDSEHNRLIEYSLDTLEQTKVISLKSKTSVKSVVGLASDKRKALLVGDHSVSLISLTNTKNPLITVFSKFEGTISHVHPSYDQQK